MKIAISKLYKNKIKKYDSEEEDWEIS